jgi:hypothetical protein
MHIILEVLPDGRRIEHDEPGRRLSMPPHALGRGLGISSLPLPVLLNPAGAKK